VKGDMVGDKGCNEKVRVVVAFVPAQRKLLA
jgi:hypothetical protein